MKFEYYGYKSLKQVALYISFEFNQLHGNLY